jgi:hypothetical protein
MSSIPLPALAIQPPQQQDPLGNISKLMAMKSMLVQQQSQQQELQIRAQQVKDQQATTAAMKGVDPTLDKYKNNSAGYYSDLSQAVLDNGGSATAATAMQQHGLTVSKTVSDIAAQDAATGSKNLETFIGKHKAIGDGIQGALDGVPEGASVEQIRAAVQPKIQELAQSGVMDPPSAQRALQGLQNTDDPTVLRQQLTGLVNATMGAKAVADQAKTTQETQTSESQEEKTRLETQLMQQYGTPAQQEAKYVSLQTQRNQGQPLNPPDAAFVKSYEKLKTLVPTANFNLQNAIPPGANGQPSAIAKGLADGTMKWQDVVSARTPMSVKQNLLAEVKSIKPDFNSGDFDVEQAVKRQATSGSVGQSLLAMATAREHMKTFSGIADALDNDDVQALNKLGNAIGVQFGSDKKTNFQIAAQAFGGEVGRAFDGAGVIGAEREKAQSNFNAAMSKGQFKGAIQTVDALLAGKQKAAHAWFDQGVQAKPDFGDDKTAAPAAPATSAPPAGATHTAMGSDGKKHYTNAQGQDLGVAPQ